MEASFVVPLMRAESEGEWFIDIPLMLMYIRYLYQQGIISFN